MEKTEKRTAEEILSNKIWNALKETEFCASHRPVIDKLTNVVYEYAAQEVAEYKKVVEELLPLAEDGASGIIELSDRKRYRAMIIINRARKLIDKL